MTIAIIVGASIVFPIAMKAFVANRDERRRWLRSLYRALSHGASEA